MTALRVKARELYSVELHVRGWGGFQWAVVDRGVPFEEGFNCWVGDEAFGWLIADSFAQCHWLAGVAS